MAINFTGEILMAKHAAPHMPRGGAIVNVGSVMGTVDPVPGAYGVSKRGIPGRHSDARSPVRAAGDPGSIASV
jgi:NAD(P)-dependent dehydrogenase (short-subunit alcohol dehydrogenase family)